jgi:N6-adenosine-specific RNA methylase IME4
MRGPYLELFARRQRSGWDVFGDQVEGSICLSNTNINGQVVDD